MNRNGNDIKQSSKYPICKMINPVEWKKYNDRKFYSIQNNADYNRLLAL